MTVTGRGKKQTGSKLQSRGRRKKIPKVPRGTRTVKRMSLTLKRGESSLLRVFPEKSRTKY